MIGKKSGFILINKVVFKEIIINIFKNNAFL